MVGCSESTFDIGASQMRHLSIVIALIVALAAIIACAAAHTTPPPQYGLNTRPLVKPYLLMPPNDQAKVPTLLSKTGAFTDVRALTPAPQLIPYDLNVPFWSDGATKLRW